MKPSGGPWLPWCTAPAAKFYSRKILRNRAPEDAFLAAIAIAQHQKARSFERRAALSLAKLYKATDRPVDARDFARRRRKGFCQRRNFLRSRRLWPSLPRYGPWSPKSSKLFDVSFREPLIGPRMAARGAQWP
jgi:hypothetical protein